MKCENKMTTIDKKHYLFHEDIYTWMRIANKLHNKLQLNLYVVRKNIVNFTKCISPRSDYYFSHPEAFIPAVEGWLCRSSIVNVIRLISVQMSVSRASLLQIHLIFFNKNVEWLEYLHRVCPLSPLIHAV